MAAPEHRTGERWEPTSEFGWTSKAYDLLEQDLLRAEVALVDGVVTTRVWGCCPRCAGRIDDRQVPTVVGDFTSPRGMADADAAEVLPPVVVVDVTCGCGAAHVDSPEGTTGCGVSFRVELVADSASGPGTP
ncbi:hypothetical protein QQM39_07415 [Streptomyces sp. DT2A-34]|uniref:hypothetical protein n=1 Tax=Streptomyces sp. DT2A-34 TaxID=3051182 RepID=UPI00265B90A2|nr:hypothetical protein [Streptomyces sp. DT2A-34]MDO0910682.1 hypothetical protein [Streptomyces sp. DT2A-34]